MARQEGEETRGGRKEERMEGIMEEGWEEERKNDEAREKEGMW